MQRKQALVRDRHIRIGNLVFFFLNIHATVQQVVRAIYRVIELQEVVWNKDVFFGKSGKRRPDALQVGVHVRDILWGHLVICVAEDLLQPQF